MQSARTAATATILLRIEIPPYFNGGHAAQRILTTIIVELDGCEVNRQGKGDESAWNVTPRKIGKKRTGRDPRGLDSCARLSEQKYDRRDNQNTNDQHQNLGRVIPSNVVRTRHGHARLRQVLSCAPRTGGINPCWQGSQNSDLLCVLAPLSSPRHKRSPWPHETYLLYVGTDRLGGDLRICEHRLVLATKTRMSNAVFIQPPLCGANALTGAPIPHGKQREPQGH